MPCLCVQAEASTIVTTAHQINAGVVPTMDPITTSQLQVCISSDAEYALFTPSEQPRHDPWLIWRNTVRPCRLFVLYTTAPL